MLYSLKFRVFANLVHWADMSVLNMAEGSTVIFTKACRLVLLATSEKPKEDVSINFARNGPLSVANSTR